MAGVNVGAFGEGEQFLLYALEKLVGVAEREVCSADRSGEEGIASEDDVIFFRVK